MWVRRVKVGGAVCVGGCVVLVVARKMPLGTRLRSAWLALFASPACAAGTQPRPPSRRAAWLRPLPAPQSEDCVRGRVHRHATLRVMRAQLRRRHFPPGTFGQRGACVAFRRRTAGYRARIRRKARHPSATAARGAWSEYLPSRRATASRRLARPAVCACSASCRRLPAMLRANEALMW